MQLLCMILENYQRMELEKKKNRIQKQMHKGPIIRYHSLTMPLIEELPPEPEISVDEDRYIYIDINKAQLTKNIVGIDGKFVAPLAKKKNLRIIQFLVYLWARRRFMRTVYGIS